MKILGVLAITGMLTTAGAAEAAVHVELRLVVDCAYGMQSFALDDFDGKRAPEHLCVSPDLIMDETNIRKAIPGTSHGIATVIITYDDVARARISDVTGKSLQHRLAVLVNGRMISAPFIQEPIAGSEMRISGPQDAIEAILRDLENGPTHT